MEEEAFRHAAEQLPKDGDPVAENAGYAYEIFHVWLYECCAQPTLAQKPYVLL